MIPSPVASFSQSMSPYELLPSRFMPNSIFHKSNILLVSNAQAPYPPPCLLSLWRRGLAFPRGQRFGVKIMAAPSLLCLPGAASFSGACPWCSPARKPKIVNFGGLGRTFGSKGVPRGGFGGVPIGIALGRALGKDLGIELEIGSNLEPQDFEDRD